MTLVEFRIAVNVQGAQIYLTFEAERCAVIGNTVENAGNGVAAYGIYVEGDRNIVQGNDVVPYDQVPAPAVQAGIRLGGQADFCIVTGNQTNGFGRTRLRGMGTMGSREECRRGVIGGSLPEKASTAL